MTEKDYAHTNALFRLSIQRLIEANDLAYRMFNLTYSAIHQLRAELETLPPLPKDFDAMEFMRDIERSTIGQEEGEGNDRNATEPESGTIPSSSRGS